MYELLVENYFPAKSTGFFIEAGAYDGVYLSTCKGLEDKGWHGINIEPDPTLFKQLEVNRPNSLNLNIALASMEGYLPFQVFEGTSGILNHIVSEKYPVAVGKSFDELVFGSKVISLEEYQRTAPDGIKLIQVKADTYSNVIIMYQVCVVDLFVLDVEFYEMPVLENMVCSPVLPKVICVEHLATGLNTITDLLKSYGYIKDWNDCLNAVFLRQGIHI